MCGLTVGNRLKSDEKRLLAVDHKLAYRPPIVEPLENCLYGINV